jgi:hypothetical protein
VGKTDAFSDDQIASPDVRRPSRHRHRECALVQGAGGA